MRTEGTVKVSLLVQLVVGVVCNKHVAALVRVGPPESCGTLVPFYLSSVTLMTLVKVCLSGIDYKLGHYVTAPPNKRW